MILLVSMLHVTLQYMEVQHLTETLIQAGILMMNQHLHPLHPLLFQLLLAKPVSSTSCYFMSCLGGGAIKMLGTIHQT